MSKKIIAKFEKLKKILKKMGAVMVAYSGGVDSSFLLWAAKNVLGDNVLAVTAVSFTYTKSELKEAKEFTCREKIKHLIVHTYEYKNYFFQKNSIWRCYWCKRELFSKLKKIAKKYGIRYILDGTNADDAYDFRPGEKAKKQFDVRSPLKEAGLNKEEIRILSKKFSLSTFDKPSRACLASRFPYGKRINPAGIKRVEKAEDYLRRLGFFQVRVRDYGDLARIEVEKEKISQLVKDRKRIVGFLRRLNFLYITADLEGYRTGSMNLILNGGKNEKNLS